MDAFHRLEERQVIAEPPSTKNVTTVTITSSDEAGTPTATYLVRISTDKSDHLSSKTFSTLTGTSSSQSSTTSSSTTSSSEEGGVSPPTSATAGSGMSTNPATTSSTPSPNSGGGGSGVSSGALAGAVVGCLIGGALLAFIAAWFFFRKRNQRQESSLDRHYGSDNARSDPKASKGLVAVNEKPASADTVGFGWQAYLPQSADDRTMQNTVKTFFDQIELHVDNYYHKANVQLDGTAREALSEVDSQKLPAPIEDLMINQRTMLSVIKHCLANLLISELSPHADRSASLLPPNLAVASTKLNDDSTRSKEQEAVQQAYSQWKVLNAYLFPQAQDDPSYQRNRDATAHEVSQRIATAFAPWQKPQEDANALHLHEKSLVTSAAKVGTLVMTQPSQYEFRWNAGTESRGSSRSLITLPGFWKTSDEKGRPLEQAQLLVSPFIVRV